MGGSALVELRVVYHQPPGRNLIGHPSAVRRGLLPRDRGPSA
jgi:hypothetical protein